MPYSLSEFTKKGQVLEMQDKELNQITKEISQTFFGKPFKHKALFNKRLRTTGGRYLLTSHNIEINPKHYEWFGKEELISIIKHELCHYHLHIEGKGYKHRDQDFKRLLKKVGGSRHCQGIPGTKNRNKKVHFYQCMACSAQYRRYRKMDTSKYLCGKCKGEIKKI
ncbi:SprT-like protein [Alteribacillus bidgolensis]|uniref:Protein SprT-like n=2 Tax=Alteribacillus bidgolensis TaxID=930129 RepID=A0A1G8ISR9_9BACI|nr:SprT-like protein [Alteribacillus bidgolensis]